MDDQSNASKKSTREQILEAAIELFAEKGYTAVSVRELMRAVGLKESSLYNHFKSKEDLLNTIFDLFMQEMGKPSFPVQQIEEGLNQMDLSAFLQHHAYMMRQKITPLMAKIWRIIYMEQYRDKRARRFVLNEIMGRPREFYRLVFQIAVDKGMLKTENIDTLVTMYQYTALTLGWEQMLREIDGEDTTPILRKRVELIHYVCGLNDAE